MPLDVDFGTDAQRHRYFVVDVFTDTALAGNQLGVFADARSFATEDMQRLARELNLAETVFILPPTQDGDVRIRIFTPATELPFAGHPVLGTAFVVGSALGSDAVRLETGLGIVPIALERAAGRIVFGRMDQPVPSWHRYERATELLAALGLQGSGLPVEAYRNGPLHVYVELEDGEAIAALRPDLAAIDALGHVGVNCFAGSGRHWKTRMFAPGLGVTEDPATGSAAGPLALHLARHGRVRFGDEIEIRQGLEIARPSVLYARVDGSAAGVERVQVGGSAVIIARGEFRLG
ncbi:MAG: PhzF family phenazine biosynthesis isomerase [Pseudonocardiaceae bacterium]|nr:PhzF family phenazine biosynthesis isomerase [Pseudonocardiaceae bacterium]